MALGPHIHDPSGHRYGKGDMSFVGKALNAGLQAGFKKKRAEIEKRRKEAEKKASAEEEKAPTPEENKGGGGPIQITQGGSLPFRPSDKPVAPTIRGPKGRMQRNPELDKKKQEATDFNAALRDQAIVQNHSSAQFGRHMLPVSGEPVRATGYGPTNSRTGGINKVRMGQIHAEALRKEKARQRNRAAQKPQPNPASEPQKPSPESVPNNPTIPPA